MFFDLVRSNYFRMTQQKQVLYVPATGAPLVSAGAVAYGACRYRKEQT